MIRLALGAMGVLLATLACAPAGAATQSDAPQPLWVPDPERDAPARPAAQGQQVATPVPGGPGLPVPPPDMGRVGVAHWMAQGAESAGLPAELPVMASLVESGLRNLPYGDRDSVGYFQMRTSIWDSGAYAGYLYRPELQLRWFVDHALAVRAQRVSAGDEDFGSDSAGWGEWIADVEGPLSSNRGRYQPQLGPARAVLAQTPPPFSAFGRGPVDATAASARAATKTSAAITRRARRALVPRKSAPRGTPKLPTEPRFDAVAATRPTKGTS